MVSSQDIQYNLGSFMVNIILVLNVFMWFSLQLLPLIIGWCFSLTKI